MECFVSEPWRAGGVCDMGAPALTKYSHVNFVLCKMLCVELPTQLGAQLFCGPPTFVFGKSSGAFGTLSFGPQQYELYITVT